MTSPRPPKLFKDLTAPELLDYLSPKIHALANCDCKTPATCTHSHFRVTKEYNGMMDGKQILTFFVKKKSNRVDMKFMMLYCGMMECGGPWALYFGAGINALLEEEEERANDKGSEAEGKDGEGHLEDVDFEKV